MNITMKWNPFGALKAQDDTPAQTDYTGVSNRPGTNEDVGVHKAYIPNFLYRPPFGYPRAENVLMLRELEVNPYVYSVIKALQDEVASTKWEIVFKEGVDPTPELETLKSEITAFFKKPNNNKESFEQLLRKIVRDILVLDSGVIVKAFNALGEMAEIYSYDGGSILKNPDIHGYLGNREDIIWPSESRPYAGGTYNPETEEFKMYDNLFRDRAAYFQYSYASNGLPVPFGKREVAYLMANPRSDSIYGRSPIQILADVIMSLVYGSNYNLDFYINNNMPEGVMSTLNADDGQLKRLREEFEKKTRVKSSITGFFRKSFFKLLWTNKEFKFTPLQLDPKVMQIIEQQSWFTKLVWTCFSVSADTMGFTEDSNKAVSETQGKNHKRRAVRPLLINLKYAIDHELITEWGDKAFEAFEWQWIEYDIDEDMKKHDLYQKKMSLGILTPEMLAKDLGVDVEELAQSKAKAAEERQKLYGDQDPNNEDDDKDEDDDKKPGLKANDSLFVKTLQAGLDRKTKELVNAIEQVERAESGIEGQSQS